MKNNWPETVDELLDECQRLINKYDLYTLGELGEPFTGETEPRVDGTEYLAGEYQYGVAMIPAQWVRHALSNATLGSGTLTAGQVREAVMSADRWEKPMGNTGLTNTHLIIRDDGWQAIADELNATLGGGECEFIPFKDEDWSEPNAIRGVCSECSAPMYGKDNYCPNCGRRTVKR